MPKILETWKAFGDMTGRYYNPVETYRTEDAETLLITMGSCGETASVAVDKLREEGRSVGLVKIRLWRPFPFDEFKKATLGAKQLVVIDRAISDWRARRTCRFRSEGGPLWAATQDRRSTISLQGFLEGMWPRPTISRWWIRPRSKSKKGTKKVTKFTG